MRLGRERGISDERKWAAWAMTWTSDTVFKLLFFQEPKSTMGFKVEWVSLRWKEVGELAALFPPPSSVYNSVQVVYSKAAGMDYMYLWASFCQMFGHGTQTFANMKLSQTIKLCNLNFCLWILLPWPRPTIFKFMKCRTGAARSMPWIPEPPAWWPPPRTWFIGMRRKDFHQLLNLHADEVYLEVKLVHSKILICCF